LNTGSDNLKKWRDRLAAEKAEKMAELEQYRVDAITVIRDGKEFTVVTIPDKYDWK
jgi:hypothetical protein